MKTYLKQIKIDKYKNINLEKMMNINININLDPKNLVYFEGALSHNS